MSRRRWQGSRATGQLESHPDPQRLLPPLLRVGARARAGHQAAGHRWTGSRRCTTCWARYFATGVNRLFRRGIDRGYVERREDLAGIRGKLAVSDTAKRALRARGRAACDFEELSADILPNRILRTSLRHLAGQRDRAPPPSPSRGPVSLQQARWHIAPAAEAEHVRAESNLGVTVAST